jgi:hypothetical protein|nr:MAG TPA: hypothetical protein [Caudoviricetes sp.]
MIINLSSKPYSKFSAVQRLALNGAHVVEVNSSTFPAFCDAYDKHEYLITAVIVDKEDFVLANDVINYVDDRLTRVVTLDVTIDLDTGTHKFNDYE